MLRRVNCEKCGEELLKGKVPDQNAYVKDMKEAHDYDTEGAHYHADIVLCNLLCALGYDKVVAEWEKVEKWYA